MKILTTLQYFVTAVNSFDILACSAAKRAVLNNIIMTP